ncbi:MAG: DUF1501 domain-containing protein [Planctomycetaceae bacterium]
MHGTAQLGIHKWPLSRRDSLWYGGLSALGLSLVDWMRHRANAASELPVRAKSCILLWLDGGPSHLETFDLKPEAPREVRGPFSPIKSSVSGIELCEHMPRTAGITHRLAIIRSMTSPLGEHGIANHYLLTGYQPSPSLEYPSYGSVLSYLRQASAVSALPPNIAIPEYRPTAGAGYLDSAYRPFVVGGDPSQPSFRVQDLELFPGVTEQRLQRRAKFLADFDAAQSHLEAAAPTRDPEFEQAYRLISSPQAKQAFDLSQEDAATREKYGPRMFGQSCLLARRLVEREVPFVSVLNTGWDTHANLSLQLRDGYSGAKVGVGLIPMFDQGFAALIEDLDQRGLLDQTLVIAMGEFGRTPKINAQGGRDHWPRVFSVVLAGGGVRGAQVIGSSDRTGESPQDDPVTPADLACTIYSLLGIDPSRSLQTKDGRPVQINQGGRFIHALTT